MNNLNYHCRNELIVKSNGYKIIHKNKLEEEAGLRSVCDMLNVRNKAH